MTKQELEDYISNSQWGRPCTDMFFELAEHDPDKLLQLLESGILRPSELTFATEIAGQIPSPTQVIPILLKLLEHPSPLVREGTIYGLDAWINDPQVRQGLTKLLDDPVDVIREIVSEVLGLRI